jgi:hypothetical protein
MKEELSLREIINEIILFFINFRILIISVTLIGTLSVIIFQKTRPVYYSSVAIATSGLSAFERIDYTPEVLNQRTAINIINSMQLDLEKKDYYVIGQKLNISEEVASKIKKINAEQIFREDENNKKHNTPKFEIQLSAFDNSIIELIEKGLINYFTTNKYVANYYNQYKITNNQEINSIEDEIKSLKELRKSSGAKIDMSSTSVFSKKGISEVQNQIIELIQIKSLNTTNQELLKPLSFVEPFSISSIPERGILIFGSIAAGFSFLLGIIIAVFKNVYIKLKE